MNKKFRIGKDNPNFRQGTTISHGYRVLSSKVWGKDRGRYEHRVIMEGILGRPLLDSEIVHHVNGDTLDNSPDNLEITTRPEHNRKHGNGNLMICVICGAEKWYSRYLIEKLREKGNDYRCRSCAMKFQYEKTCQKCGSKFLGGMPARYCQDCTEKARGKRSKRWQ